jgi:phosphoribosylformimino-5-aminoimidazole carboxamide ribotide isomerase
VTRTTVSDLVGFYWNKGFKRYICTDIAKDGTMTGPSFGLYQTLMKSFSGICLIASGGVSSMDDLVRLETEGLSGAIVGKALLEGSITVRQLADWGR